MHAPALWLSFILIALAPRGAQAGDQEPVFFGEEAAMAAGAITAVSEEAGAIWYNPAGLAAIHRNRVSLSGSNLMVRLRERRGMLQARLADGVESASDDDTMVGLVPLGLGYARSLSDRLTIGAALFIREHDTFGTRTTLTLDPSMFEDAPIYPVSHLEVTSERWKVDAGIALGWQATETLRVGIGLWGNLDYRGTEVTLLLDSGVSAGAAGEGAHLDLTHDAHSFQGFAVIGLQWRFAPGWQLGAIWRTAEASLWRRDETSSAEAMRALSPVFGRATLLRVTGGGAEGLEMTAAPLLRLGVAYSSRRGWISLEGDVGLPHVDQRRGYDEPLHWNVRLGGHLVLTERVTLGAGLFTASSGQRGPDGLLNPDLDAYGMTGGIQIRSTHRVDGDPNPTSLIFSTSLGGRYAFAVGRMTGLLVDPFSAPGTAEVGEVHEVRYHDISLFLGSAILF